MKPLYQISQEFARIIDNIDDDGEISDSQIAALQSLEVTAEDKATNIAAMILNLEADDEALCGVLRELSERQRGLEKKINFWRNYLQENLAKCQITNIKTPLFDIKLVKNPPRLEYSPNIIWPSEYIEEQIIKTVDKQLAKEDLKKGIKIPGAWLAQYSHVKIG